MLIERDTGNWYASPHTLSNDEINEHFMKHCLMKAYLVPVKAVTNDAVFFPMSPYRSLSEISQ